ncbi:MAG: hypothetical protein QNJ16_08375 [Rhodobacter sp.]|nr:hypothetical protein [Rhodobacter sp.]
MRRRTPLLGLVLLSLPAAAAAESYTCSGSAPAWRLRFDDVQARLEFPAPTEMEVKTAVPAEGADWPRAFTLIGARDTAIVLLEREACGADARFRAHVLTQRAQTPILLTGCCTPRE